MGQRSQIYIRLQRKDQKPLLIAKYFQWNYGERMISRAKGTLEYLHAYKTNHTLKRVDPTCLGNVVNVNFDMRDVADNIDLVESYKQDITSYYCKNHSMNDFVFYDDNNDGMFFLDVNLETGKMSYAFTDCDYGKVMTPEEYLVWDYDYEHTGNDWKALYPKYDWDEKTMEANISYIKKHATLMSENELEELLNDEYECEVPLQNTIKSFIESVDKAVYYQRNNGMKTVLYPPASHYLQCALMIVGYLKNVEFPVTNRAFSQTAFQCFKKTVAKIRYLTPEKAKKIIQELEI